MGHVWLIGIMGSGKSTVGRRLADRLGRPFYDTDHVVERATGTTIARLFEEYGEPGFREHERAAVAAVASSPPGVVATGGGAILDETNVDAMRSAGRIILIETDTDIISARLDGSGARPLLSDGEDRGLQAIAEARVEIYRAAADAVVDGRGSIETVTDLVEAACNAS